MSAIKINQLSYTYPSSAEPVFKNLSLNLDSSWKLALVGRNGRGKTTFLKLLSGQLGNIPGIQTAIKFEYYPQELPIGETVLYSLLACEDLELWRVQVEMEHLGLDEKVLDQPFASLSGGEQSKLLLAVAFSQEDGFPLLDEPTNHLDQASREEVAKYLLQQKSGYIVVSHDRQFLSEVSDHTLAIENGEIHLYQDSYAGYEQTKQDRDQENQRRDQKLRREIKSLTASQKRLAQNAEKAERGIKAKGKLTPDQRALVADKGFLSKRAAKQMQRARNVERRLDDSLQSKEGLLSNIEKNAKLDLNFSPNYHQDLLVARHLSAKIGDRELFSDLNLIVKNHGVVALTGKNGSGKSSLLKEILGQGELELTGKGNLFVQEGLTISYLPQDFDRYRGKLEVFAEKNELDYSSFLNQLKKLGLPREAFKQPIESMSQGQKKRVALAKSLVEPADFYLWDEPANYLDLFNQDQLIELLKEKKPAMILVDHDQAFIEAVAEEIVKL